MKTKKPAAAQSAGSLVLELTTDTTPLEANARAIAAGLLAFASKLRDARIALNRKKNPRPYDNLRIRRRK